MKHVAIDLGGRESQLCIRSEDGAIISESRVSTRNLLRLVKDWDASRVVLETSAEAFKIADAAAASGHQVRVVPATLVKQLGVGARGIKNDRRDARTLSEISCRIDLPSVHVPSHSSRELKSICGSREALVNSRTLLINNVRGWLRTQLARIRTGATTTFPSRVREHLRSASQQLPMHVERQLGVIEALNAQIKEADNQLRKLSQENELCRRLMTVPGIGPITAIRFMAAVDDVKRFRNAHAVQSYLGLTPGERSSSDRKLITGITKAGPSEVRRSLIQAAWCTLRYRAADPILAWAKQVEARRGKFVAVVATARKLAGILYALWRDGTRYQPSRAARPLEQA